MILIIDVGNTTTAFAVYENDEIIKKFIFETDSFRDFEEGKKELRKSNVPSYDFAHVAISSVVTEVEENLKKCLCEVLELKPSKIDLIKNDIKLDMKVLLDNPKEIGVDLLCDGYAVREKYGNNTIIIDMGTASKVLLVDSDSNFAGGAIAPGLMLSRNALLSNTSLLKGARVEKPKFAIGTKTRDCINSGLVYGTYHMIKGLVEEFEEERHIIAKKVLTGGNGAYFTSLFKDFIYDENLTLDGCYKIYKVIEKERMRDFYKKLAKPYYNEALENAMELCKINSVYDASTVSESAPYGAGIKNALNWIERFGKSLGFDTKNIDNRCVEMTYGTGKRLVSIFAHTDVVPATGEWSHDPFDPIIVDGKFYCRGSSDDKGPLMSAIYAAKLLNDNKLIKDYRVRIVVGGDEERGSSCLEHYFARKNVETPDFGFTPDSDFPLIYGEKCISNFKSTLRINLKDIIKIEAGVVPNAVIDKATFYFMKLDTKFLNLLSSEGVDYDFIEKDCAVVFHGLSAHGSVPEYGKNAAIIGLKYYAKFYNNSKLSMFVDKISDTSGRKFNCYGKSDNLGETTFNIGILNYSDGSLNYITNFRHPETVKARSTVELYDRILGTVSECLNEGSCLLFDKASPLVKNLLEAYQDETGDYENEPMYTGGGTYAKEAKNTVAFGAVFPGENTHMHEPDEFMNIEHFNQCISIYAHAIHLLGTCKK